MADGQDSTDPWSDVVIDPTTGGTTAVLFAAVGNDHGAAGNGVFESTNGGMTWTPVSGLPSGSAIGRISLAIAHPANAASPTLYASISTATFNGHLYSLERSTDGGATWNNITANLNGDDYLADPYTGGQGGYDNVIEIDPTNPNVVFAAGDVHDQTNFVEGGIVESQDGGLTWTDGTTHPDINTGTAGNNGPHSDYHALAFDADGRLVVGNDGGVWRLDSNALTPTPDILWTDLNGNLDLTQFRSIALDPANASIVYGGSQDNGTERYSGTPEWTVIANGDGGITAVDPTDPNRLYQEYEGGLPLRVSTDPTATAPIFTDISNGIQFNSDTQNKPIVNLVAPFVLDSSGDVLYGTDFLNLSTNHGSTWSQIGIPGVNGFNPDDRPIDAIAVAPSNKAVVYVSFGDKIFVTQNATAPAGNVKWTEVDLPGALGAGANTPDSIAVDPNHSSTAYAVVDAFTGVGNHVFMTTNFGKTWTDISASFVDSPASSIALVSSGSSTLVCVGTDVGVYATANGGATWERLGTGLPNVRVTDLDYVPSLNILAAGTFGRGAYELSLAADLSVSVTGPSAVTSGGTFTYTVTVTNNGPADAQAVTLSVHLPVPETFLSQMQTSGPTFTLGITGHQITDSLATLADGGSATFKVTVQDIPNNDPQLLILLLNTATVSSATSDPTPGNNSSTLQTTVTNLTTHLTIHYVGPLAFAIVTATNTGDSPMTNVVIRDTVPAGTVAAFADIPGVGFVPVPIAEGMATVRVGTLASGQSVRVYLLVDPRVSGMSITDTITVSEDNDGNEFFIISTLTANAAGRYRVEKPGG
jgi:uncharacterized repeat protein (TIGR01451 family)